MILHTYNSFSSNNSANARSGNFVILLLAKSLKTKQKCIRRDIRMSLSFYVQARSHIVSTSNSHDHITD